MHEYTRAESMSFVHRDEAAEQLVDTGITDERRMAYTPGVSELLYRTVIPAGTGKHLLSIVQEVTTQWKDNLNGAHEHPDLEEFRESSPIRDDGFRLYLGLPQHHNSFSVSQYQPEHSTEDKYYYAVNGWFEHFLSRNNRFEYTPQPLSQTGKIRRIVSVLETPFDPIKHKRAVKLREDLEYDSRFGHRSDDSLEMFKELTSLGEPYALVADKVAHGVVVNDSDAGILSLGHVMLSLGHDEDGEYIAYYDRWDFGQPGQLTLSLSEASTVVVGKPFEVYDRLYFDRAQFNAE
ncbi:MAG: hypothetical protein KIH62_004295 [Candidatus Kerfeldbacteria bacterium]|nr:hypothetical protein [Candidatus Kerfeldbacteria bacterium]